MIRTSRKGLNQAALEHLVADLLFHTRIAKHAHGRAIEAAHLFRENPARDSVADLIAFVLGAIDGAYAVNMILRNKNLAFIDFSQLRSRLDALDKVRGYLRHPHQNSGRPPNTRGTPSIGFWMGDQDSEAAWNCIWFFLSGSAQDGSNLNLIESFDARPKMRTVPQVVVQIRSNASINLTTLVLSLAESAQGLVDHLRLHASNSKYLAAFLKDVESPDATVIASPLYLTARIGG